MTATRHAAEHGHQRGRPAPGRGKADRYEEKRHGGAEGRKRFDSRQNREFYDRCDHDAEGGGQRECKGAEVRQIAFW